MNNINFFKNKKITVMGLGLLGRGVGDVEFLARHGADLIVTDLKSEEELATSLDRLREFSNIQFVLGEHRLEDFRGRDFILKAAGVPSDSVYIKEAQDKGIPVEMSTALFADLSGATIIGITGTRGKSTVTHMIFETLQAEKEAGNIQENVWLGGNVRGVSTLALLDEVSPGDIAVLELDSWQLQGFRERKISPHIAVFTTLMRDHMNYYKDDLRAYFFDKAAIYENQKAEDRLIASEVVAQYMKEFELDDIRSQLEVYAQDDTSILPELTIPGKHNLMNARLALAALETIGITRENALRHLARFSGVEGRLQKIAEKDGIDFFNDTAATTPEAASAGIKALGGRGIVLIAGGSDKGLDFTELVKTIDQGVKALILLPGAGTDRLLQDLKNTRFKDPVVVSNMQEAVSSAVSEAQKDDVVLLSPGCASFGLFKNEFDRGDQFVEAVQRL